MDWLGHNLPTTGPDADGPRASHVLRRDVPTCSLDDTIGSIQERLADSDWEVCGVVNEASILLGMLRGKCWEEPPESLAGDVMREGPSTIRPNENLTAVTERMQNRNVSALFVTKSDGELVGILRRVDAEAALEQTPPENSG